MGIMDWLQDPQNQAALLGMTQGFTQAAQPTRMPLGFGAALGMGGVGALQGKLQGYPDYQLKQADLTGKQQQNQIGAFDLQQRQGQANAANNAPVPMGFDPAAWALIKSNPQAASDIYKQQFNNKNQLANEQALKLSPSAPSAGMSPEAFGQQEQLKNLEFKNQAALQQKYQIVTDPFGNERLLNVHTGEVQDVQGAGGAGGSSPENTMHNMAKMIANYQSAPLSGFALAKPMGQAIMAEVSQINPQYQAQNYGKSQQAYRDFGSGKKGDLTRSFNVSISHLNTLDKLTDALGNGNVQALNAASNAFKEQFGSSAPTNFNAAKAIVGDEIIKAIVGGGGALADRENAQNQISAAKTPAQLKGVIGTYKDLMSGQLRGLRQQYEQSTMRKDFDSLLSEDAKRELETKTEAPQSGKIPFANAGGGLPTGVTEEDIRHTLMLHPETTRAQLLQKLGGQ